MAKKQINSTYLVAEYLIENKDKSYIHDMKRKCKANNVGQRISLLRYTHKWKIDTILERYEGKIAIYYYKLIKVGKTPEKYL